MNCASKDELRDHVRLRVPEALLRCGDKNMCFHSKIGQDKVLTALEKLTSSDSFCIISRIKSAV